MEETEEIEFRTFKMEPLISAYLLEGGVNGGDPVAEPVTYRGETINFDWNVPEIASIVWSKGKGGDRFVFSVQVNEFDGRDEAGQERGRRIIERCIDAYLEDEGG